jgi:type VI secretion system protein ImpC
LELATLLRGLLHHPDFQALEATWRGAEFLVRNFGGDERIKLLLLDVSKAELTADLGAQELLDNSGLWRVLHRQADKAPLAVCVGLFTFCGSIADIELLGRLANISHQIGAPLLAGASPDLAGCDSFQAHPDRADWKAPLSAEVSEAWRVLRELPQAGAVGLALPRFLCRLPYGGKSLPIESFPFEEMPDAAEHESYLWGNSALLCSYLLAEAFRAEGWSLSAGGYGEVGDMPVHKLSGEEENEVKPCAEAWLNQPAADTLAGLGLMPVLSIRGRDAVRVDRVQSLAGRAFQIG